MKSLYSKYLDNSIAFCILLSIALNLIIETLGRRSPALCLSYLVHSPQTFFYNTFIIFATLSVVYLVKRRIFACVVVSILWLAIGITNGIILGFRTTPFTMADFALVDDVFKMITVYLTVIQIVLIALAALAILAALVLAFIFTPAVLYGCHALHVPMNTAFILLTGSQIFAYGVYYYFLLYILKQWEKRQGI